MRSFHCACVRSFQCLFVLVTEYLCKHGRKNTRFQGVSVSMFPYCVLPDRTTAIGQQIDAYLNEQVELEDHSIHLLFAANRWELV